MRDTTSTSTTFSGLAGGRDFLQQIWQQMKPRERRAVALASFVIFAALLWWLALAPALKTLRQAPEQHRRLDAQIQTMQGMSREAKTLQNQPKLGLEEAQKALQNSVTQRFASAGQVSFNSERATVTLKNANPRELALWLTQARVNARALPSEVKLIRNTARVTNTDAKDSLNRGAATGINATTNIGPNAANKPQTQPQTKVGWDGTLILDLPKK